MNIFIEIVIYLRLKQYDQSQSLNNPKSYNLKKKTNNKQINRRIAPMKIKSTLQKLQNITKRKRKADHNFFYNSPFPYLTNIIPPLFIIQHFFPPPLVRGYLLYRGTTNNFSASVMSPGNSLSIVLHNIYKRQEHRHLQQRANRCC